LGLEGATACAGWRLDRKDRLTREDPGKGLEKENDLKLNFGVLWAARQRLVGSFRLKKRQLNQVSDSTEQSDVKRHREDGSEPALNRFVRQDHRSGRNIVHVPFYP
jgi:hypothetical protein